MTRYFWRYSEDGEPIGAVTRNGDGDDKELRIKRWNGEELDYSNGEGTLPFYIGGAESREPKPKDPESARELWRRLYDGNGLADVEGEKNAEDLRKVIKTAVITVGSCEYARKPDKWEDVPKKLAKRLGARVESYPIYIYPDNDDPGAEAAKIKARVWSARGFPVYMIDMTKRPNGEPARPKYDISDYLNDGGDVDELIHNAQRYDPIKDLARDCALKQGKDDYIASDFPVDTLPFSLRCFAEGVNRQFKTPLATNAAIAMCVFAGFLGAEKAKLTYNGLPVYTPFGVCAVGESGSGKSPVIDLALARVIALQDQEKQARRLDKTTREFYESQLKAATLNLCKGDKKQENKIAEYRSKLARPITYQTQIRGDIGLIRLLDLNATSADARAIRPNGAILHVKDASKIFNNSRGGAHTGDVYAIFNAILDYSQFNAYVVTGDVKEFEHDRFSAGCIFDVQPSLCRAINDVVTRGQGFLNRLIWCSAPWQREGTDSTIDITGELAPYYDLFEKALLFPGGEFSLDEGAAIVYESWKKKNNDRRNQAHVAGDSAQASYITKATKSALQFALVLRCAKCFERAKIIEGTKRLEDIKTTIDAETMKAATRLINAYIAERNAAWELVENTREDGLTTFSNDAQDVLKTIKEKGESRGFIDVEGKQYEIISADVSTLMSSRVYRGASKSTARRDKAEGILIDAGFMFLSPRKKGQDLRIAVIYKGESNGESTN